MRKGEEKMKRRKLNKAGKMVVGIMLALILFIAGAGLYLIGNEVVSKVKDQKDEKTATVQEETNSEEEKTDQQAEKKDKDTAEAKETIAITLDEWIGWKSLLDANGGLTTQPGSIYDKMGLNVEFIISNDATASSNMLIKGDTAGAGYTVNRYAFLNQKFKDSKIPVKMVYITNFSNGGDGIISKASMANVTDLIGKKIAIPEFSEAQTLVEWLIEASDLTEDQKKEIRSNYVLVETPDDAARVFFSGEADAAATWEPYLTQAQTTADARIFFSTAEATNLILDGLVFREDFLSTHQTEIQNLIDGALQAAEMYTTEFEAVRGMPLFAEETEENIVGMAAGAKLATWNQNMSLLTDEAITMFSDMSSIWLSIGEKANPNDSQTAFESKYMEALGEKYADLPEEEVVVFTEEERKAVEEKPNTTALLTKSLTINFGGDSAVIQPDSYKPLNEFAEIAKNLNGIYIQVEGNTADIGGGPESGKSLSEERARAIALYLEAQGINPERFIVIGNGASNPVATNDTEEGRVLNRRTDIFFKSGQ